MTSMTDEIKHDLSTNHEEYKTLLQEHHDHERRLAELASKSHLSMEEELEEKRLKKEKLHLKDRMEQIVREHRARLVSPN
ncbi:MAG TPA: DUF465 domain-containing protein [Thermoanaerobaculia bacterium]|nr:DUF465 domain-containing protein [Thermoanaerobaculia bacterium]